MKVWILMTLVSSGHFINSAVPTLEFKSQKQCEAAVEAIARGARMKDKGTFNGYCVEIEKE